MGESKSLSADAREVSGLQCERTSIISHNVSIYTLTRSMIEVFYVDTGKSGRVDLSDVAAYPAPHLYDAPCQALQCSLYKAQPVSHHSVPTTSHH